VIGTYGRDDMWTKLISFGLAVALFAPRMIGAQTVDAVATPLTTVAGDSERGRAIIVNRQIGLCLLCHSGQFEEENSPGNLAPGFEAIGKRLNASQLRARVMNMRAIVPSSIMPVFYEQPAALSATQEDRRILASRRGQTLLTAQQVEDVVAFLASQR
jgi:L-cysteine S-thiosulfotransferase